MNQLTRVAIAVNKLIHDECQRAPHDLGGRIVFDLLKDDIKTRQDDYLIGYAKSMIEVMAWFVEGGQDLPLEKFTRHKLNYMNLFIGMIDSLNYTLQTKEVLE